MAPAYVILSLGLWSLISAPGPLGVPGVPGVPLVPLQMNVDDLACKVVLGDRGASVVPPVQVLRRLLNSGVW